MTHASAVNLSLRLAQFATRRLEAPLPSVTMQAAARVLLDATGVMRAASTLAEVQPFVTEARDAGHGACCVLGTQVNARAELAALANGAMAHALDYEDTLDSAPLHPNASLIPAVLAVAQSQGSINGRTLLEAVAVGCDVACRLALCLRRPLEEGGWYPPPIVGAWGAVAAAARILNLTPRQLLDAWSLLLLQNSCAGEIKHDRHTALRAVREAFPAQIAVQVTRLALAGVRGFDAPLEGQNGFFRLFAQDQYDAEALFHELGQRWHIDTLSFKPWPSCRGTHAAIECALQLREAIDGAWLQIRHLRVEGCPVHRMLAEPIERKRAPQTAIDAKFSLPFTVATALVTGKVELDSFDPDALQHRNVQELAQHASFSVRSDWGPEAAVSGAVEVELLDGRTLRREVLQPRGSPSRPLEDAELLLKFVECAGRAQQPLKPVSARALGRRILELEGCSDGAAVVMGKPGAT
jgi:2-methylcitrate dehydratase PrpD